MNKMPKLIVWPCLAMLFLSMCAFSPLQAKEMVFDGKALAKFGTKKYKMIWIDRSSGAPVEQERGTIIMSANVTKDTVTLKNTAQIYLPDGKRFIKCAMSCSCSADGKLSLRRIDAKVIRSDKVVLYQGQSIIEQDKIKLKYTSQEESAATQDKWTKGTLVDTTLFFLVPQLPRKKGESITFENVMAAPTDVLKKPISRTITCLGIDPDLSIDGQKLTKFVDVPKGKKTGITYWVDGNGLLRRILLAPDKRLDLIVEPSKAEARPKGHMGLEPQMNTDKHR